MVKKIDIGQKAKVEIVWATSQSDYSREQEKNIISMMAQKYGIPAKNIRVTPSFVTPNNDGVLSTEGSDNIHDPKFMQELMQKYILEKGIKDIDFKIAKQCEVSIVRGLLKSARRWGEQG